MYSLNSKRILLVVDAYKRNLSAALVTKHLVYLLHKMDAIVGVYSTDIENTFVSRDGKLYEFPRPKNNRASLLQIKKMQDVEKFKKVLKDFSPEIVHFVPIGYGQSGFLIDCAKTAGCLVVGQLWGHNFYCTSHYGVIDNQECFKCANGRFFHAILNNCGPVKRIPLRVTSLYSLRRFIKQIDIFMSTGEFMDMRLQYYGIESSKIKRLPLPFSAKRLEGLKTSDEGHIVYYGQVLKEKGVHFLYRIVNALPEQKFEFYFPEIKNIEKNIFKYNEIRDMANVKISFDLRWETGVAERVAKSRVILLPSLWPVTPETALMESLGLGKPIVAFNVGIHNELLKNKYNAMVISPGDIDAYIKGLKELLSNGQMRKKISRNALNTFNHLTGEQMLTNALFTAYDK